MKIAVSATGKDLNSKIDPRFGRASYFVVVDSDSGKVVEVIDNTQSQNAPHGAGINAATSVVESGAQMVLTGHVGPKAFAVLQAAGVNVASDVSGSVGEAIEKFKSGSITPDGGPNVDAHQGMPPAGSGGGMGMGMGGMGRGRNCGTGGMGGGGRGQGRGGCRRR